MKQKKTRRTKLSGSKNNEKEVSNHEGDVSESKNDLNNDAESDEEVVQRKSVKKSPRRSGRKISKKYTNESSEEENDNWEATKNDNSPEEKSTKDSEDKTEAEENYNEDEFPKKKSGKKSPRIRKSKGDDEINGEKVQTKNNQRKSSRNTEGKNQCEPTDPDDAKNEETEKPVGSAKKGTKRKSSDLKRIKPDDGKKNEESDEENEKSKDEKNNNKKQKKKAKEDEVEEEESESEEYEVEKLVDIYFKKDGKREFLVRWKGFSAKDDTWEPESHLNCQKLIDAFLEKCEKAKSLPMREMRTYRQKTDRFGCENFWNKKLSARLKNKPRTRYFDKE